jgi:predicted nucleic acid-binding protein
VYLIDANIIIYAENKKDKRHFSCRKILKFNSNAIKIGTTDVILSEVQNEDNSPFSDHIMVYKTGKLTDEIANLRTNFLKQPSPADLSLVQAAMEHPEVKGIITYDRDFGRIATQGVIQKRSATTFWLGNASSFLRKYEVQALQVD